MISDEDKERVRQATNFLELVSETVELRQRGQEFWGCCPFHDEKTPSFKVNPQTGLWYCFGCSQGGDIFDYVQRREHLEFLDALRYLAERAHIELHDNQSSHRTRGPSRARLLEALEAADDFFNTQLLRNPAPSPGSARAYLKDRGFGSAVAKTWHLGYAAGGSSLIQHLLSKGFTSQELLAADLATARNGRLFDRFYERLTFPIHDELGKTIAFGARVIPERYTQVLSSMSKRPQMGKYINTRDTAVFNKGKHLFAYDRAKESIAARGFALVCEGYTDVIALHEVGITYAVATLGTAFRIDHIRLLERQQPKRIICLFDGDEAGQRAAERSVAYIDKTKAELRCVILPHGQDPMEFLAAEGVDALKRQLAAARPLMDVVLEKYLLDAPSLSAGGRVEILRELACILAPLKHSLLLDEYATRIADALNFDAEHTKQTILHAKPRLDVSHEVEAVHTSAKPQSAFSISAASIGGSDMSTADDRTGYCADASHQAVVERELLVLLLDHPELRSKVMEFIPEITWSHEQHQALAWAFFSASDSATPSDLIMLARQISPHASQILSAGYVSSDESLPLDQKLNYLVDTLRLQSAQQEVRRMRAHMSSADETLAHDLLLRATELQKKIRELQMRLRFDGD